MSELIMSMKYPFAKLAEYPLAIGAQRSCTSDHYPWKCTRPEGHAGVHGAGIDDSYVVAEWIDTPAPHGDLDAVA